MSVSLGTVPNGFRIVDKNGAIVIFFRMFLEAIRVALGTVASTGNYQNTTPLAAALTGQVLFNTTTGGRYRVTYYLRRTVVDGVSSSLQFTWHWTENGVALSKTGTLDSTDTTGDTISESKYFFCDANVPVTFDVAYTSNTPGLMKFNAFVDGEHLA